MLIAFHFLDSLAVKRKKTNKPDVYTTAPAVEKSADRSIELSAMEEQPDPDERV